MEYNKLFLQENNFFKGLTPVFAHLHICFKPKIGSRWTSFEPLYQSLSFNFPFPHLGQEYILPLTPNYMQQKFIDPHSEQIL